MALRFFNRVAHKKAPEVEQTTDEEAIHSRASPAAIDNSSEVSGSQLDSLSPVLKDDDELFLRQVTSEEEEPPALPPRRTIISDDGTVSDEAINTPLPTSPADENGPSGEQIHTAKDSDGQNKKSWNYWTFIPDLSTRSQQIVSRLPSFRKTKEAAEPANPSQATEMVSSSETASSEAVVQESRDLSSFLSKLDLSSINNRAVGISNDTQKLLESFTLILKDIVNGVPTAYSDLEKLLTERQAQLDKLYNDLPPWAQSLVKTLPAKMYAILAPQIIAAANMTKGAKATTAQSQAAQKPRSKRSYIPSLRSLVTQKGAVAAMLRSIFEFLKLRFPAILAGTNVLMSLAVFILLFVFWYCHKRGREERLARVQDTKSDAEEISEVSDNSTEEISADVHIEPKIESMRESSTEHTVEPLSSTG